MKKIDFHIRFVFMLAAIFLLTAKPAHAQVLTDLQQSLEKYRQSAVQEKLYVHTDKSFYLTGEILWFKIYAVNAADNLPLSLSKLAYVDVIDNNHNTLIQAKIELKNATGNGSIYIPVSVNNGNYKLRVYTNWMKNFSPAYYFEKTISIVNPLKTPVAIRDTLQAYDIQLLPEGGNLVKNISGKIAFKVLGKDGKGINFNGAVINQHNDTVVKFSPLKFGMGSFTFTPAANNSYRAVFKIAGTPVIKPLPAINDEGYVLQVSANGTDRYNVLVKSNVSNRSTPVYLLVHTRQQTKIAESKQLENGVANFTIDKAKLDDGISSITIFNGNKQPVCERLIFKYPSNKLIITANTDQHQYGIRKKVSVNLSAKNKSQAAGNLSVAVYRLDSLQTPDDNDILSYLWLSSDLKGNIESPGYYLKNDDAIAAGAMDNLLLTQGWRRFKWNDILTAKTPHHYEYLPEYNGHLISAQLKSNAANVAKGGVVGYLGLPGKRVQLYTAKSDSAGKFLFNAKLFYGAAELVAQTDYTVVDSTYRMEINTPFSEKYAAETLPALNLKSETQAALRLHSIAMQAQNIYSANKANRFFEPLIDSSAFYGKPTSTYLLDNYTRFPTMEEVLREYVTGISVIKRRNKFEIRVINGDNNYLKENPLVMLDGVPIFDVDKAFYIDPLKVNKLEIIDNRYFYGPSVSEGILSFTTYKGNMGGFEIDPKAIIIDYEGLSLQREFYSPVYETSQQITNRLPDFRNLLYWAPNIVTHAQGKDNLSFYTSDLPGKYIGIIQGITIDGSAGSQYFNFEVKK